MSRSSAGPDVTTVPPRSHKRRLLILLVLLVTLGGAAPFVNQYVRGSRIESLSTECRDAEKREDWPTLKAAASALQMLQPHKALPLIYLAEAEVEQGNVEAAAEFLQRLPDDDPLTPPSLLELSGILFGPLNRAKDAAEVLERILRIDPLQCEARRRIVYYYAFTLQRRKMAEHARAAIRDGCDAPETYIYLFAQDWLSFSNAHEENTRWLSGYPNDELFLVARTLYRVVSRGLDETDEPEKAGVFDQKGDAVHRKLLAEYLAKFPQNLELLAYHLKDASTLGEADRVQALLEQAPPESADDYRFWRYLGWLHNYQDDPEEAEKCYLRAIEINPLDHVSRHQLAAVYRKSNRAEEVKALEELVREGNALRKEILQLPSVRSPGNELLERMANFAANCGDQAVAEKLRSRLHKRQ